MKSSVAVVTGAAQGIGRGIVERLLRASFQVVAVDVDDRALADLASDHTSSDGLEVVFGDIGTQETWQEIVRATHERFGPIGVLVNNAAISPKVDGKRVPSDRIELEEWERVLRVNLTGAFLGFQATVDDMRAASWGRIINMSSGAARMGARVAGLHYGASKAGLLGLTRTLALELGPDGITVNAIAPGRIATPMALGVSDETNRGFLAQIPVGRLGVPDDIAGMVEFLASDDAGFITGATFDVNGGGYIAG